MEIAEGAASRKQLEMENLTFQIKEGLAIKFTEKELQKAGEDFANSLVVKIVGNRGFNRIAFKTLKEIWKPAGDLKFIEIEGNVLIAKFANISDRDKVLNRGPWRYMGWALHIEKWMAGNLISELFNNKIQIWMQVHNLPIEYRNKRFAYRFASKAGTVIDESEDMESKAEREDVLKFIRFRIQVDLSKPIVQGWTLDRGTDSPVWIEFRYEKLPNACFSCGRFNHEIIDCCKEMQGSTKSKFGVWLRVEHSVVARVMQSSRSSEFGRREGSSVAGDDTVVASLNRRNFSVENTVIKPGMRNVLTDAMEMNVTVTTNSGERRSPTSNSIPSGIGPMRRLKPKTSSSDQINPIIFIPGPDQLPLPASNCLNSKTLSLNECKLSLGDTTIPRQVTGKKRKLSLGDSPSLCLNKQATSLIPYSEITVEIPVTDGSSESATPTNVISAKAVQQPRREQ